MGGERKRFAIYRSVCTHEQPCPVFADQVHKTDFAGLGETPDFYIQIQIVQKIV